MCVCGSAAIGGSYKKCRHNEALVLRRDRSNRFTGFWLEFGLIGG